MNERKTIDWTVRHVTPEPGGMVVTIQALEGEPAIGDCVQSIETGAAFVVTGFPALGYGATAHAAGIRILGMRPAGNPSTAAPLLVVGERLVSSNLD